MDENADFQPTISQVKVRFIIQVKQPQKYGCLGYQVYYVGIYGL